MSKALDHDALGHDPSRSANGSGIGAHDRWRDPGRASWQADFNHSGPPTVNAGDLSYFAGRLGKNCSSQKAGDDYDMDVTNLEREDVLEWLAEYGVTAQQVIAEWQAMGLSYDVEAAGRIASRATHATVQSTDWTGVKELFK